MNTSFKVYAKYYNGAKFYRYCISYKDLIHLLKQIDEKKLFINESTIKIKCKGKLKIRY